MIVFSSGVLVVTLLTPTVDTTTEPFPGITYTHRSTQSPRKEIHILQADLTRDEVRIRATRSNERGKSPSEFSDHVGSTAAAVVNGDFFAVDGTYNPSGLAIGQGTQWSDGPDSNGSHFIACTATNECTIETGGGTTAADDAWHSAVGGRRVLKRLDGTLWSSQQDTDCGEHCTVLHPRTAVGLKDEGTTLVMVVVEGRQDPIFGMKISQLASLMDSLGCDVAMELDGGGSSTMVVDGARVSGRPDNEPSERRTANQLAVIYDPSLATTGKLVGYVRENDIYNETAPIGSVTVSLSDGQTATTNGDGYYEFDEVEGGTVTVTATHADYQDAVDTKEVEVGVTNWKSLALIPFPISERTDQPIATYEVIVPVEPEPPPDVVVDDDVVDDAARREGSAGDVGCAAVAMSTHVLFALLTLLLARVGRGRSRS